MHRHLHMQEKMSSASRSHQSLQGSLHADGFLCTLQVLASAGSSARFEKMVGHCCKSEFMHLLCCIAKLN